MYEGARLAGRRLALTMLASIALQPAAVHAQGPRPAVAILPVQIIGLETSKALRARLDADVRSRIATNRKYRLIPPGNVARALRSMKKEGQGLHYADETKVQIGVEVAAALTVTVEIIKLSTTCAMSVTVFSVSQKASVDSYRGEDECTDAGFFAMIDAAIGRLFGETSGPGPGPPLRVGIRPWGGFVGGVYYNDGLKAGSNSRFAEDGVNVELKLLQSIKASIAAWKNGEVDILWMTVDDFAPEYRDLAADHPRLFLQTAWSRGEEVLVVRKYIKTLNDLETRRIGFMEHTAAHSFLLISLDLAGLGYGDVRHGLGRSEKAIADAFIRGDTDAAILWIGQSHRALKKVKGAKVLESTKDASFLLAESLAVKEDVLRNRRDDLVKLATGWLRANAEINEDRRAKAKAIQRMVKAFRVSKKLAKEELDKVRLTTLGDNQNFFGLNSRYLGEKGEDLYTYFWGKYCEVDASITCAKPEWSTVVDTTIVRDVPLSGYAHRAEDPVDFSRCQTKTYQQISDKTLDINFASGKADLTETAKAQIIANFGHLAEIYFHDCIRIDGHTDNRGPVRYNEQLSKDRAESVKAFLVRRYGFDGKRIVTVGYGPKRPIADNRTANGRAANRRTEFELLH